MGENKGHGMKGNNYDELSGVGTSSAGITGTTGNLNNGVRDGGIGKPSARDAGNRAGNRQSAELDDDVTPALGTGTRGGAGNRQSPQSQSQQSGSRQSGSQQSGSQQSGSQQPGSRQGQSQQSGAQDQQLGRSLDQDVMGKEQ
ncbi:hypothetical protein [Massilia sp.]|uniref:hypothetical protein n=1 Tax=Massilia sp. TaxID=1882437 RepID=UPI0028A60D81|nr:hypothetical protein [Massilia sp.]